MRRAARRGILSALAAHLFASVAFAADSGSKLYRWVDDQGNVHYTDQVPPSQVKQGHTSLSEDGLRTNVVPPVLTGEALKQAEEEQARKAEEKRQQEAERAADLKLLQRYRTVEELVLARDGRIAGIEASIQVKRDLVRRELDQLEKTQTERQKAIRAGKPVSDKLDKDIEQFQRKIREGYLSIIDLESEKDAVRSEFAATIQRFKRLKKLPEDDRGDEETGMQSLPNMVSCRGSERCRSLWERASAYLREHSDKGKEISASGLLIGFQKDQRESRRLMLSWTQKSPADPVNIFFDLQCKNRLTASLVCTDQSALKARDEFRSTVLQSVSAEAQQTP